MIVCPLLVAVIALPASARLGEPKPRLMNASELIAEVAIRLVLDWEPRFLKPFALDEGLLSRVIFLGRSKFL